MKKFLRLQCMLMIFISCKTSPAVPPNVGNSIEENRQDTEKYGFSVAVSNQTIFNVSINKQTVWKNTVKSITLPVYNNELSIGFDIIYEIPLSDSVSLFCKGDKQVIRKGQASVKIKYPLVVEEYGCYVSITNKTNTSVGFANGNSRIPMLQQNGNYVSASSHYEFAPHETAVYKIDTHFISNSYTIKDGKKDVPLIVPEGRQNFLFQYEYNSNGLLMTDARPLHRAGEKGWTKVFTSAKHPLTLAPDTDGTLALASTDQGPTLYAFDSAGIVQKTYSRKDSASTILAFEQTGDERLLLVGYEYNGAVSAYTPFAQKQTMDGMVQWLLPPSSDPECWSAYFTTLSPKDASTWLLAGGADTGVNASNAYRPYLREIHDSGTGVESLWELAPSDFDSRLGAVKAAVYDPFKEVWYITGALLDDNSAYICMIADGKILGTDTNFAHFSFSKICAGNNGYYLVGEEEKANGEVYATLLCYSAEGNRLWQQSTQLKSHSYYQAAVLDSEYNQLVLAGSIHADKANGQGGKPFIQAVDLDNGAQVWLRELNDPAIAQTMLVYIIIKAPDYGYVLSLSGIADDFYEEPFIIVRVNVRGSL